VSNLAFAASVSPPDPVTGTVTVTVGDLLPVVVHWCGSVTVAVHEALDLLECEPHVVGE
jgi:hypothetical protein